MKLVTWGGISREVGLEPLLWSVVAVDMALFTVQMDEKQKWIIGSTLTAIALVFGGIKLAWEWKDRGQKKQTEKDLAKWLEGTRSFFELWGNKYERSVPDKDLPLARKAVDAGHPFELYFRNGKGFLKRKND